MILTKPSGWTNRDFNKLVAHAISDVTQRIVSTTAIWEYPHCKTITIHQLYKEWAMNHSGAGDSGGIVKAFLRHCKNKYKVGLTEAEIEHLIEVAIRNRLGLDGDERIFMFTQKHYVVLAGILRESMRDIVVTLPIEEQDNALKGLAIVVSKMATTLQENNPRFKREQFLCALKSPAPKLEEEKEDEV